jgi:hypothetical protein
MPFDVVINAGNVKMLEMGDEEPVKHFRFTDNTRGQLSAETGSMEDRARGFRYIT